MVVVVPRLFEMEGTLAIASFRGQSEHFQSQGRQAQARQARRMVRTSTCIYASAHLQLHLPLVAQAGTGTGTPMFLPSGGRWGTYPSLLELTKVRKERRN